MARAWGPASPSGLEVSTLCVFCHSTPDGGEGSDCMR